MAAWNDNPNVTGDYVWIYADDTTSRRSRASQASAARRAYQAEHGVTLTLIAKTYSETHGFTHRTAFRYQITRKPDDAPREPRIITNNVPREIIDAGQLTDDERAEFDYLNWPAIDEGSDSASFIRYRGDLMDLGTFMRGGPPGWDGCAADSFFSGTLVRISSDGETVIVGRIYS